MRTKRAQHRNVGGITSDSDWNASDPPAIMARIERIPAAIEVDIEPSVEIHWCRIGRHTDVTHVSVDVPCGNVERAAQRDPKMCKVPANTDLLRSASEAVRVARACA